MRPAVVVAGLMIVLSGGCQSGGHGGATGQTLERIAQVASALGTPSTYAYGFDPSGLLTSVGARGTSYGVTRAGNVLTAGSDTYVFDALGRVTAIDDLAIAYGPDGQIDHATQGGIAVSYVYDEDGQRILKSRNGAPVAAYVDGAVLTASELDEPVKTGGRAVGVLRNGLFSLAAEDARGTVQADLDGTSHLASPFGGRQVHPDVAAVADYAAQGFDADLGVDRMGVRDYDARVAMFLQPDPLFLLEPDKCVESPVECNMYGYAKNRPLDLVDPTGTEGEEAEPTPPPDPGPALDSALAASSEPKVSDAEMNHLLSLGPTNTQGLEALTRSPGIVSYEPQARQYAKPETVEALFNVGAAWRDSHPDDPRVRVGDISLPSGGHMAPHVSHQVGLDADIRPMRNDGLEEHVRWTDPAYSRDLTRQLVQTILANGAAGVQMIFFNDPQLQREFPGVVRPQHGHDDHLHVRFVAPAQP